MTDKSDEKIGKSNEKLAKSDEKPGILKCSTCLP